MTKPDPMYKSYTPKEMAYAVAVDALIFEMHQPRWLDDAPKSYRYKEYQQIVKLLELLHSKTTLDFHIPDYKDVK
jgi:hypothetical protein